MRFFFLFFVCTVFCNTAQARAVQTPPLIQAVQSGHMRLIGQLIRGGNEINAIDAWGRTATHYAVARNNRKALKFLLDNGADANLADNDGNTPLDMWHKHENKEMLTLLHAAGAKPSFTKVEGQQPAISPVTDTTPSSTELSSEDKMESQDLWQAAANNDHLSAERLLAAGAHAKAENDAGKVPFDIAIEAEHYALAAVLLKAAVGINGRDKKGWTPLYWAIFGDAWDLVRELIREGADLSVGRSQNALDVAKSMKSEAKLIEAFIAEKGVDAIVGRNGETMLMLTARKMHTEIVKPLINNKADPNSKNRYSYTALMLAATWERMEIVKLLIDNGADLNIKNNIGNTALMLAVRKGNTEIVKLLLDNKADISDESSYDDNVLMDAARYGHTEIVKLLLDNKADPNSKRGDSRYTALIYAAEKGYKEIAKLLIENKADLNIQNSDSYTALMRAAEKGCKEIVKLLINNKADLNIKNKDGKTALGIAKRKGQSEIINILRVAQQGSM